MKRKKHHKAEQLRSEKHNAKRALRLAARKREEIQATEKTAKQNKELKQHEQTDKKWYKRVVTALKQAKWWIIEHTWIRILNIFRNLFKKNG